MQNVSTPQGGKDEGDAPTVAVRVIPDEVVDGARAEYAANLDEALLAYQEDQCRTTLA